MLTSIAALTERRCFHRLDCAAMRLEAWGVGRPHPSRRAHARSTLWHLRARALLRMRTDRLLHQAPGRENFAYAADATLFAGARRGMTRRARRDSVRATVIYSDFPMPARACLAVIALALSAV